MAVPVHPPDKPDSTRQRLIEAAVEVFSERGYERAGVQEIARRAGLTTGAIYGNFRGKADLLSDAIGTRSQTDLKHLLGTDGGARSAGELLAHLGSHLLDGGGARVELLVEAFVAARRDPELATLVRAVLDERVQRISAIAEQARAEGNIADSVSIDAFVRFSLVLVLGSLLYRSLGIAQPDGDEWKALIHRFVDALSDPTKEPS